MTLPASNGLSLFYYLAPVLEKAVGMVGYEIFRIDK